MSTANGNRRNLVGWIRLDGNGNIIPGSAQYRPRGVKPKDGYWRQIQTDYTDCVGLPSTITFLNGQSVNVTAISTADGAIDWTGTLGLSGLISFVIPFGYDETFSVTLANASGRGMSGVTKQGSGTITVGSIATVTTITTTADPNSQYLVTIS